MTGADRRVLVVDDERFFREAIGEVLSAQGIRWESCEDGESALQASQDPSVGVVVLDIRLPGIDGIEVLRRLRETRPDLCVIMLSASTDQELVLEALRLGASDYLAKPLHDEELLLAVRRAAERNALATRWEQLRRRLDQLVAFTERIAARARSSEGEERQELLFRCVAEALAEVLDARKSSVMLLDGEQAELQVVAASGHALAPADMSRVPLGEGVAGVAFELGEAMAVTGLAEDPRFAASHDPGRYETESCVLAPLEVEGERIGLLCAADRRDGGDFGGTEVSLVQLICRQLAELLAAGRIAGAKEGEEGIPVDAAFEAESESADVAEEADRNAEIAREICEALATEIEPADLFLAALRPIERALRAAPVSLYLAEGGSGDLVQEVGLDGGLREDRPRLPRVAGLTGAVFETGCLVASPDPPSDPRFDAEVDTPRDGKPGPLLCVPLRLRGKSVGVCRVFPPQGAAVSARGGELISAALSAAVRNVLLYRSLIESIDEVATVRRESRHS
ncbi:MAG: response regulator [Deltaproteobacteria bacterium]|nr:response regulator [Deltaproteobacteria bacterium]MBW2417375.1 response regulator [Deltaproteobacteria bacterium]